MGRFLVSVIIPTRNRQRYANEVVRHILKINKTDIQIVIQDNSDNMELKDILHDILDMENIKYNYSPEILSFVDNFSLAISLSEGDYLSLIGDDDGITSALVQVAKWAKKNNIDAIKPDLSVIYYWPDSKARAGYNDNGILKLMKSKIFLKQYNPVHGLKRLLKYGCQSYLDMSLVKIYHGLVKKDYLEQIKTIRGTYVGGLSPDIYLSVALSILINNAIEISIPITISGICSTSGSSASATGLHTGKLEDAPHFKGHDGYIWSEYIPKFYSVETIWADSALAAVNEIDASFLKYFHPERLVKVSQNKYPQFKDEIWSNYSSQGGSKKKFIISEIGYGFERVRKSIRYRLAKHETKTFDGIVNIEKASDYTEREFKGIFEEFYNIVKGI